MDNFGVWEFRGLRGALPMSSGQRKSALSSPEDLARAARGGEDVGTRYPENHTIRSLSYRITGENAFTPDASVSHRRRGPPPMGICWRPTAYSCTALPPTLPISPGATPSPLEPWSEATL